MRNMKTSKWLVIAMAAAVAVGGFTVIKAQATPAARRFAQRHGALVARVKEQLGLTDEQLGRIRAELRLEKETLTGLLKRLRSTRAELRDTIQQQGATEEMVRAASAKVAEVEADMAVER